MADNVTDLKERLSLRIDAASSIADITATLCQLQDLMAGSELAEAEGVALLHSALEAARGLCRNDPVSAWPIIERFLYPLCVRAVGGTERYHGVDDSSFRKLLVAWIEQYPQKAMETLRDRLLASLCSLLDKSPAQEILWTIGSIGFRSAVVLDALWKVAGQSGPIAATATGTLAGLGLTGELRTRLIALLSEKTASEGVNELLYAIQETASKETFDLITSLLPPPGPETERTLSHSAFLLLGFLTRIADAAPDDSDLQDRVWDIIRRYKAAATNSAEMAGRCNAPGPVLDYANWLLSSQGASGGPSRYIFYDRLGELVRPRHLDGWEEVPRDSIIGVVKTDCCADTKMRGRWTTTEFRLKSHAWETALSLGLADVVSWLEEAIANETNPYAQHAIMELVASVRVPVLPDSVIALIRDVIDVSSKEDMGGFFPRSGAITLARSSSTRQAFNAMLDCGLTIDGNVLRATSEALGELAVACLKSGDADIVDVLFAKAFHGPTTQSRGAAINALSYVARNAFLNASYLDPLVGLASDAALEEFSQCKAIEAIGYLAGSSHETLKAKLLRLVRGDGEIGWRVLEALLRRNVFDSDVQDLISKRLRIETAREPWLVSTDAKLSGWQGYIAGLLYLRDPVAFAPLVADALRRTNSDSGRQLLPAIVSQQERTPAIVADALVDRVLARYSTSYIETGPLEALAVVDVERFLAVEWHQRWNHWMPDGRAVWCDSLCGAKLTTVEQRARAITLLSVLAQDGNYPVRRAAFRALSVVDPNALLEICREWCRAETVLTRVRAAEAAAWIPTRICSDEEVQSLGLAADRSRAVRESSRNLLRDRRNRDWATKYLDIVIRVGSPGGKDVIDVYRYGRALERLGDDWTARQLRIHVRNTPLPRHVVHWISQVTEGIEKRWRDAVLKWREPSFNWEGTIEEIEGTVRHPKGKIVPVRLSLWNRSRLDPSDLGDWGGVGRPSEEPCMADWLGMDEAQIAIPGRKVANVLFGLLPSTFGGSLFLLHGNGPYPLPEGPPS